MNIEAQNSLILQSQDRLDSLYASQEHLENIISELTAKLNALSPQDEEWDTVFNQLSEYEDDIAEIEYHIGEECDTIAAIEELEA